jgi:hypothetical protein
MKNIFEDYKIKIKKITKIIEKHKQFKINPLIQRRFNFFLEIF